MALLSTKLRAFDYGGRPAVSWWCPGCVEMHAITVDAPKGWKFDGNCAAPTFEPSIMAMAVRGDPPTCRVCHCFIRAGRIEFLDDCSHWLRGLTVDLPDLPEFLPLT